MKYLAPLHTKQKTKEEKKYNETYNSIQLNVTITSKTPEKLLLIVTNYY